MPDTAGMQLQDHMEQLIGPLPSISISLVDLISQHWSRRGAGVAVAGCKRQDEASKGRGGDKADTQRAMAFCMFQCPKSHPAGWEAISRVSNSKKKRGGGAC